MSLFRAFIILVSGILIQSRVMAQEDLLSLIEDNQDTKPKKVYATFKTVKICNAQSIETVKKITSISVSAIDLEISMIATFQIR